MWDPAAGARHSRAGLRYGSDLTDAEWAVVAPLLPKPRDRGRHRRWRWREVLDAIFYVLRAGCPWLLPSDSFPPWRTVYRWFGELRNAGGFEGLHRNHRLAKDFEPTVRSATVFLYAASAMLLSRRIARYA